MLCITIREGSDSQPIGVSIGENIKVYVKIKNNKQAVIVVDAPKDLKVNKVFKKDIEGSRSGNI